MRFAKGLSPIILIIL